MASSNLFSGAATDASTGAAIGSVIPGLGTAIGAGIGGLAGLFGGLFGGPSTNSSSGYNVAPAGADEQAYQNSVNQAYGGLQSNVNAQNYDQFNSQVGSTNQNYLDILNHLSQTGGLPNSQQIGAANGIYQQIYAPAQTQLNQQYLQSQYQNQQQAASMGRSINDPVLQAKLQTGFMNNQAQLNSQIASGAAQYAQQLPGMQAQYAGQAAGAVNSLAANANANRQTLLSLGNTLQQQQQNFRLNSAGINRTQQTGGSIGGAIGGALGGIGLGALGGNFLGNAFGSPSTTPSDSTPNAYGVSMSPFTSNPFSSGNNSNINLGVNTNLGFSTPTPTSTTNAYPSLFSPIGTTSFGNSNNVNLGVNTNLGAYNNGF